MGNKHICLPFASAALYREYVDHPAQSRQYLRDCCASTRNCFLKIWTRAFPCTTPTCRSHKT